MAKIFPIIVKRIEQGGDVPLGAAVIVDSVGTMEATASFNETSPAPSESLALEFDLSGEVNPAPTHTDLVDITTATGESIALMSDVGELFVTADYAEANPAPSSSELFDLDYLATELIPPATHTDVLDIAAAVGETNPTPTHSTGDLELVGYVETNPAVSETHVFDVSQAGETNPIATETQLVDISTASGDANPAPAEARTSTGRFWHQSQTNTGTSGITNPDNVRFVNDGTNATLKTVTLGTATISITARTGATVPPTGTPVTGATYIGYYAFTAGTTSTKSVLATWTGGSATIETSTGAADHSVTPIQFDLFAVGMDTLAKAQSLTIRYQVADTVVGIGGSFTIDAASIDLPNIV